MQPNFRPGLFSPARVDVPFFTTLVVGELTCGRVILGEASYSYFEFVS